MFNKFIRLSLVTLVTSLTIREINDDVNCTITEFSQVENVTKNCNSIVIANLTVPEGKQLRLNLKNNTILEFQGVTTFKFLNWAGPLINITGNQLYIKGAEGHVIYGQGELYWDSLGSNGGVLKPKFFRLEQVNNSIIENILLKNCPVHCVSISESDNLTLSKFNIDVSEGDKNNFTGHNTDGFDISGTNILIKDSVIHNQDDCVAANRGANITISNLTCYGGHGLSISVGFVGKDFVANSLYNVTFENSLVHRSPNGIHIKTHSDSGSGIVSNVTYRNIRIEKISNFGINIQQDYSNGEATGVPGTNIPINGLKLVNVTGYMESSNGSPTLAEYILCGNGSCSNWEFENIIIQDSQNKSFCNYTPDNYTCINSILY